ncbi:MAG: gamma carbonic anhydrase family protein [Planctomycetota bacterium]|nr:MAG: gamma carbonic anhydrase family protein [Planctomycetota bacterium]
MACILPINGVWPQMPEMLAPNATLVGDVRFGEGCSVWFQAVLRADINAIRIGDRSNIQDHCVVHLSKRLPCIIGSDTSLGHRATAHACTIGNGCLLGMHCVVLDGASIGDGSLVAAGAVVPEGMEVPPGHLVAGIPARVVKPLRGELRERMARIAGDYVAYQQMYPDLLRQATEDI